MAESVDDSSSSPQTANYSNQPTCGGIPAQPIRDFLLRQVFTEPAGSQEMISGVKQKFAPTCLVYERTHQGPEDGEDPRRPDDEDSAERLRIVGLAYLYDVQQSLHPRSPEMSHVETV